MRDLNIIFYEKYSHYANKNLVILGDFNDVTSINTSNFYHNTTQLGLKRNILNSTWQQSSSNVIIDHIFTKILLIYLPIYTKIKITKNGDSLSILFIFRYLFVNGLFLVDVYLFLVWGEYKILELRLFIHFIHLQIFVCKWSILGWCLLILSMRWI